MNLNGYGLSRRNVTLLNLASTSNSIKKLAKVWPNQANTGNFSDIMVSD